MSSGEVLAFVPEHDARGKRDVTHVFRPRARRFVEMHGGTVVTFDNLRPMELRASIVLDAIEAFAGPKLACCAFFCHGWTCGIQAGFDLRSSRGVHPQELAKALAPRAGVGLIVPLYCCSTAGSPDDAPGGDGGFADALRDELLGAGLSNARVDAHTTRGHATRNPNVRRFDATTTAGGRPIVPPDSSLRRTWRHWLRREDNDLWFPWLETDAIYRSLRDAME